MCPIRSLQEPWFEPHLRVCPLVTRCSSHFLSILLAMLSKIRKWSKLKKEVTIKLRIWLGSGIRWEYLLTTVDKKPIFKDSTAEIAEGRPYGGLKVLVCVSKAVSSSPALLVLDVIWLNTKARSLIIKQTNQPTKKQDSEGVKWIAQNIGRFARCLNGCEFCSSHFRCQLP